MTQESEAVMIYMSQIARIYTLGDRPAVAGDNQSCGSFVYISDRVPMIHQDFKKKPNLQKIFENNSPKLAIIDLYLKHNTYVANNLFDHFISIEMQVLDKAIDSV